MRTLILIAVLLTLASPLIGQEATDAARQAEVLGVVRGFHAALAAGDSATALGHLHPDVVIFESGHAETLDEYRRGHLPADMGFASATTRAITREAARVWGDQALYTSESHTTGRWRDRDIDSHGAETVVLVRERDGWRIRHIHWSSR